MGDESLYNIQCVLMVYNDSAKQWVTCGSHPFVSIVYILHSAGSDSYRFLGMDPQDGRVLLDSAMHGSLKYNQATPVFHQWRDSTRQVYGIKFNSQDDADGFADAVRRVLDTIQRSQQSSNELHTTYSTGTLSRVPLPNGQNFMGATEEGGGYATPTGTRPTILSHARVPEPAYSQTKWASGPPPTGQSAQSSLGRPSMQRRISQPVNEHNGSLAMADDSGADNQQPIHRRSASSGNVMDDNITGSISRQSNGAADAAIYRDSNDATHRPPADVPVAPPPPPLPAINSGGLSEALKAAQLRKTPKAASDESRGGKIGGTPGTGTLGRSSGGAVTAAASNQGGDMMSEMARRLQERRAKSEQVTTTTTDFEENTTSSAKVVPAADEKAANQTTPFKAPIPPPVAGKDTAKADKKLPGAVAAVQSSASPATNVVTAADLENLKRELTNIMRTEIANVRRDILNAIATLHR